ncbi:MAG: GHKL domain-containing protein [Lachnospiraceae bacterium]|nr:GHKL domain-containing protein [Lachnospiraceae bacterium]
MIITFCYIIIYILEASILWQYCKNLFQPKYSRKTEFLALFFCYALLFSGSLLENFWINFFLFLIINFIYIFLMYHLKWLTAFLHSFLITMMMVLSELVFFSILSYFTSDFYDNQTYFRNLILLSVPSKLLYFLILQCTSLYIKKRKTRELSSDKSTLFFLIIPLISEFIAHVLSIVCLNIHLSLFLDILISISILLLLAINIFFAWFHTSIQEKNQQFLELQLLQQKEYDTALYFEELHKQDEKQKILIHDIRRHLLSIADLNKKQETDKIASYINQIIQSSDLQNSVRVCDNNLLNTILFRAKRQCKESDISFITDIRSKCIDFLPEYDITALFSNLLDNALDAAKDIPGSFIELNITPHNNNGFMITMINSCHKNPFSKENHQLISTKKNKWRHGYGMKSIQRIIEKYDGNSRLYFDENSFTFHTIIILKQRNQE